MRYQLITRPFRSSCSNRYSRFHRLVCLLWAVSAIMLLSSLLGCASIPHLDATKRTDTRPEVEVEATRGQGGAPGSAGASSPIVAIGLPSLPLQALPPSKPAKLAGARGPLSARQSAAIIAGMSSQGEETRIFDHHLALEEAIAGTPLMVGNRTTLFEDGESTYTAMFKAIAGARDHINIETYIIEDDEIGRKFSTALIEKQKQGVQVALIYDGVGSLNTSKEFFQRLNESGIKTLEFNPINPLEAKKGWQLNQRDHRKLMIIDGQTAFLGGINISSVYSSGSSGRLRRRSPSNDHKPLVTDKPAASVSAELHQDGKEGNKEPEKAPEAKTLWRDTHLMVEGPVVAEFQKNFMESWRKQKGGALPDRKYFLPLVPKGKEVVRAIASSSDDAGGGQMYNTLLSAINSAETSVLLTNAYFAPDEYIMAALAEAVGRGVDVVIILPTKTDSSLIFHAGRSYYNALLTSGVKVYERRDALLHAKTALIDGVWSTIGSTNLDWRSFLHNDEINAVVLGPEFGKQMHALFQKDLAASTEITRESWAARSFMLRLKEQAARLWVYWL